MKIVLTNDDGFGSLGIETVEEILKEYGEVYVFAPSTPQSGMSCSFTTYCMPLTVHKVDDHHFRVEGTPVDCVLFANAYLKGNYDAIVSGCNHGYNICNDIMYSGTCGACEQGLVFKKKCIAFSAEHFDDNQHIKEYVPLALKYLLENNLLSDEYYWNVNIHPQSVPFKGMKITKLFLRYLSKYTLTDLGNEQFMVKHVHDEDVFDNDDFDVSAVHNGYISMTPISFSNFKEEVFHKIIGQKLK